MTEAEFRNRLAALGLILDPRAFAAAWLGAQQLREQTALIDAFLDKPK